MNFKMDRQYMYNSDKHCSKIISYKTNNLATMNTIKNMVNVLTNTLTKTRALTITIAITITKTKNITITEAII